MTRWICADPRQLVNTATHPIARLELALLSAWRPHTLLALRGHDGCVVRHHGEITKRANSALVLAPTADELRQAADWYVRHGRTPLAMVPCGTALPGRTRPTPDPEVLVMTASVAGAMEALRPDEEIPVAVDAKAPPILVDRTARRARPGTAPVEAQRRAISLLMSAPDQLFSRTPAGSVGRLALTGIDDTAVIDGLYVPPWARRRGEATTMIGTLVAVAAVDGAQRVALEVERSNDGAIACYLRLGFRTHHRHRYVTAQAGPVAQ